MLSFLGATESGPTGLSLSSAVSYLLSNRLCFWESLILKPDIGRAFPDWIAVDHVTLVRPSSVSFVYNYCLDDRGRTVRSSLAYRGEAAAASHPFCRTLQCGFLEEVPAAVMVLLISPEPRE